METKICKLVPIENLNNQSIMETIKEEMVSIIFLEGKMTETEVKVINAGLKIFRDKGLKFTMDDLAKMLGMSKKTIYKVFNDKEELLTAMVDYVFDEIKLSEAEAYTAQLSTVDKLRGILAAFPDLIMEFNYKGLYEYKDKYPKPFEQAVKRLESGWEKTRELMQVGIDEGSLKDFNMDIFQLMYEAAIERMIATEELDAMGIELNEALEKMVDVLIEGIRA